ncbi:MAG: 4Fe-4S double cluster binding domain-containing protein [Candidatus Bathyarchaeia archaeon]|jgi:epoxyqueuosine reductase QueG
MIDAMQKQLRDFAESLGVDHFGVADLAVAKDFLLTQGGEAIARFPRAVSIGVRLIDAVVDELPHHEEPSVIFTYRGLYNSVNSSLDKAALFIAKRIQDLGFEAYPIPAAQKINPVKLEGAFSHKLAAHLAGLGWIGRSCLLITSEHGPRVRWATILTNAPMNTGNPPVDRCGNCSECIKICPVKAFTGVKFKNSESREARFNAHLCNEYMNKRAQSIGDGICGLCVYICPYGRTKKTFDST